MIKILFSLILIFSLPVYSEVLFDKPLKLSDQNQNKYDFFISVADNDKKRMKGLMHIKKMRDNQGMLFVWKDEKMRFFWMKNTYIPLDILFFNSKGELINFVENAKPFSELIISSEKPSKFVLEINGDLINNLKFNLNSGLKIDNIKSFQ